MEELLAKTCHQPLEQGKQSSFVMDGHIPSTGTISWDSHPHFAISEKLTLKRAAAKIRLQLNRVNVKSTENGRPVRYQLTETPSVRLVHYASKTSLTQMRPTQTPDYTNMPYKEMTPAGLGLQTKYITPLPLYSYENSWEEESERETFLIVKLMLKSGLESPRPYYYRIPVNYRRPLPGMSEEEKAALHKIERNFAYSVSSSITVLGSEDEGLPMDIESDVTIEPWTMDRVNGDLQTFHYLAVKDRRPIMLNEKEKVIEYTSDLQVEAKIDSVYFFIYEEDGTKRQYYYRQFDNAKVDDNSSLQQLTVRHRVPSELYVPVHILLTVTQKLPFGEKGEPLSEKVHVIQFPPKYVTAERSVGLKGGKSEDKNGNPIYADFRFYETFGASASTASGSGRAYQTNDFLYRVTTHVNTEDEIIGDPTGGGEFTLRDEEHNKMISPEFIIASQHGMSVPVVQFKETTGKLGTTVYHGWDYNFGPNDPFNSTQRYPTVPPYVYRRSGQSHLDNYIAADERCYEYFEDEYGTDGFYTEYYNVTGDKNGWKGRTVKKTFKYKGRWRLPTLAELEYINKLQKDRNSAVKYLLWGDYYWTGQSRVSYNLNKDRKQKDNGKHYVRCVFDTYNVNDNKLSYE